jgi:hypothetical protein
VSYEQGLAYDRKDLSQLLKAFKAMDAEATKVAAETGYELSKFTAGKIKSAGAARTFNNKAARRIVDGVSISRTSKIGQLSYGFARQRFSGGGSTRSLWAGFEFGSSIKLRKDGKVSNSFHLIQVDLVGVVEDGLSSQPFARFSLN